MNEEAGNPEALDLDAAQQIVQRKRLLESLDEEKQVEQLKGLLTQEPVRDLLWRILARCHVFGSVFHTNYGQMSLSEGSRQIGLWLLKEIAVADPQALLTMQLKANQLAQAEESRRRTAGQRQRRP